jgi:hypothetical protein
MRYFLFILVTFYSLQSTASDKWQHIFGGTNNDEMRNIINAKNGGWITTGYTKSYGDSGSNVYIIKWNIDGKMEWQRVIGGINDETANAAVEDSAGNIFVTGNSNGQGSAGGYDAMVMKLDSSGSLIWEHLYGGTGDDNSNAILLDSASNIIIAGSTYSFGAGNQDAWLLKINDAGTLLWSKTFGTPDDDYAKSIACVKGGGYILAGRTSGFGNNHGYAIRTTNSGDSIWTNAYDIGLNNYVSFNDVKVLSDSDFIFTGVGDGLSYSNMIHLKTNLAGNLIYIRKSNNLCDEGDAVIATPDGGYVISGTSANYGHYPVLSKFTSAGILLWENIYHYNLNFTYNFFSSGSSFVRNNDGSFTIAGSSLMNASCCTSATSYSDGFIMKIDSSGITVPVIRETITTNTGTNFCDSSSVNVILTAPAGYSKYQWFYLNGCTEKLFNANAQTYSVTEPGLYYCLLISDETIYYSNTITITVIPIDSLPIITPSGIVNRCIATSPYDGYLNTTKIDGINYQWLLNSNPIPGATASTYYATADGLYSVNIYNNCGSATSATTEMHVNTTQNVSVNANGSTTFCSGSQSVILSPFPYIEAYTYTWLLNNTSVPTYPGSVTYYPMISGNYKVILTNACGTDTSEKVTVIADSNPIPSVSLYGNSTLTEYLSSGTPIYCGSASLICNPTIYQASYEWKLNGNILPFTGSSIVANSPGSYIVKIIDSCGTSVPSLPLVVNAIHGDNSLIVSNTNSCDFAVFYTSSLGTFNSYQWFRNGINENGNNNQFFALDAGTYYCTFQPTGCSMAIPTNSITISSQYGFPSINASPSQHVCSGNVALSVSTSNANYEWKKNGVIINGATSQSYTASISGTYRCIITRPGCSSDSVETIVLIGHAFIISSSQIICQNSSVNLRMAIEDYGASYQWKRNGVDLPADTDSFLNVTLPGVYKLEISGICGNYVTNSITLTVDTNSIFPAGNFQLCAGESMNLSTSSHPGYKYKWYDGFTLLGDTDTNITVSNVNSCNCRKAIRVYITVPGNCSYFTQADTISMFQPAISNNIYSSTSPYWCGNGNVKLNARIYAGYMYQWYRDSVAIPAATSSVYSATTSGNYFVAIPDSNNCVSHSDIINVRDDYFYGTIITTGDPSICYGNSIHLSLDVTAASYQWFNYSDSISGETTQNFLTDTAGIYSVAFSNNSGCTGTAVTAVNLLPHAPISIYSLTTNACNGDSIELRFQPLEPQIITENFQWYFNGSILPGETNYSCNALGSGKYFLSGNQYGCPVISDSVDLSFSNTPIASITSLQTSLCITSAILLNANSGINLNYQWKKNGIDIGGAVFQIYFATSSGNYSCLVSANCGSTLSNQISITSSFLPLISSTGNLSFCEGDSVLLNATPASGTYTYKWENNNSEILGASSNTYYAKVSGNYTVEMLDSNECANGSNIIAVNAFSQNPSPQVTAASGYICPADYISMGVPNNNYNSFQWNLNGDTIPGATSNFYFASHSGQYTCSVTNVCGSGISDTLFLSTGSTPVINNLNDTIVCIGSSITLHAGNGNQYSYLWNNNSTMEYLMLNSTTPNSDLVYVTVTNVAGCSITDSTLVIFDVCDGVDNLTQNDINIFPNPSTHFLHFISEGNKKYQLQIFDLTGKLLKELFSIRKETIINVSGLSQGLYFIRGTSDKIIFTKQFVKD